MSERLTLRLIEPVQAHKALATAWTHCKPWLIAGHKLVLEVRKDTRSSEQNRRLWSLLTDLAQQVNWHGNKLTADEWKCVMSASLKRQKVVPGLDGGFVVLGQSTSKMTRAEMAELQELIEAFGAQQGVSFKVWEGEQ